jgi:hypothetical protein
MSFMAYSVRPTVAVDIGYLSGNASFDQEEAAGATPPTFSCNCRLAGPVPLLCTPHLIASTGYVIDAITREYEMTLLR